MPRLTDVAIQKKRANPTKRLEIHDGHGLYLVIQPSGHKSWAFRYRSAGKSRKLVLGPYGEAPAIGVAKARALASAELVKVKAGGDPARDRRLESADTFESVARHFVERYARPKNRSWKETARLLGLIPDPDKPEDLAGFIVRRRSAVDRWGSRKISDIRRADVIALLDDVADGGAPVGANRVFSAVRKLFNWAESRYGLDANPCHKVQRPTDESSRDRVLSDDELRLIWDAAGERGWPFGTILQLLILTGQRRDEVASMTWSELDFAAKVWKLPRGRVKNDKGHEVPLSALAVDIIRTVPKVAGADLLFTTTGKTPVSGFSKEKAALEKAVGFNDWWLHDLRRTMASGMARLGIALPVIEKVLNHTSGSFRGIVGVYQRHEYADEKRHALDTWAAHINRTMYGKASNVVALRG
jgi:integrase